MENYMEKNIYVCKCLNKNPMPNQTANAPKLKTLCTL